MINTYEGSGGWTIEVINGDKKTRFECNQYIITDENGIHWFDWDAAMKDALKIDKEQCEQ